MSLDVLLLLTNRISSLVVVRGIRKRSLSSLIYGAHSILVIISFSEMVDGCFNVGDRFLVNSDPAQALLVSSLQVIPGDSAASINTWFVPLHDHGGLGDDVNLRSVRLPRGHYKRWDKCIKKIQKKQQCKNGHKIVCSLDHLC